MTLMTVSVLFTDVVGSTELMSRPTTRTSGI